MPQLRTTGPTAAIAGIAPGVQSQGIYAGRRQLFVRFAAEAETAVLYTPEMLARQLGRSAGQSTLHSVALCGRDPLASGSLIAATFSHWQAPLGVMLDTNGQRPEALTEVLSGITMVQVTVDFAEGASQERALASLGAAAAAEESMQWCSRSAMARVTRNSCDSSSRRMPSRPTRSSSCIPRWAGVAPRRWIAGTRPCSSRRWPSIVTVGW